MTGLKASTPRTFRAGRRVASTPAFQSQRRESEAQRRPPAAGPRVELARICFPCTSPACQPLDLSRSHCPASLRRIWEVRQRRWGRSSCFLRLSVAANSPRTWWCCGTMHRYLPRPQQVRQNRGADQHDSGAIPPSINIDRRTWG